MDDIQRKHEIAARRLRGREAAEKYVKAKLLPALGLERSSFQVDMPSDGLRSLTYFVTIEPGERLVLRCVASRDDTTWLAQAHELFRKHLLPAPRLVHFDSSLLTRWRWGWSAFTEQFIVGQPASTSLSRAQLASMGLAYAEVHQVTSARWGKPHRPRTGDMIAEWVRWAQELRLDASGSMPPDLGSQLERLAREIQNSRPPTPDHWELCHNRVTPTNVLISPGTECFLIDLERVKYGLALSELASIEADVLSDDKQAFEHFLEGYSTRRSPPNPGDRTWVWHRRLVRLKRVRDAALRDDLAAVREELERT